MNIIIKAIKFNHDPNSASHDALNIRKNKSQFIDIPEWVYGTTTKAEDSLSAYAIKETQGNTIAIQARFKANDIGKAEIRAIAIDPFPSPFESVGFGGWLGWLMNIVLWILGMTFGNVLGEVKAKWVTFSTGGDSGYVTFELENPKIGDSGVGIHFTTWKWLYRLESGGPWIDIDTTRHKIYVLLEVPKDPWKQSPYVATNGQLPWTEVLSYSCEWASGSKNRDTVAGKITERVNGLGEKKGQDSSVIEYDCQGGGSSHYIVPATRRFNCTQFIDRLNGGQGTGKKVNCTDCATIVSTFANILGCDLWQSRMHEKKDLGDSKEFLCNEIIAIGYSTWDTPCGWDGFLYHEVAWKGACGVNDEVFDACLKVDGDNDPADNSHHTPLLPINMKFGNKGDLLYRDRLAAPNGRDKCNPQPSTQVHREVV